MQNKETKEIGLVLKHKKWLIITGLVFLAAVLLISVYLILNKSNNANLVDAKIGGKTYILEVVNTDATRVKGLSDRNSLPKNTGMLFDFGKDGDYGIWMKDMNFSIDIAWLDSSKKIIKIKHNASPSEYPEVYRVDSQSLYVIEVNSGTFKNQKINIGDKIDF